MYNENGEKTKRILQLAAIGAIAIVLVGVVVLGMVTGHWPWEKEDQAGADTGMPSQSITDTAGEEDTTGEALPEDVTTQGTVPGDTTASSGSNSGGGSSSENNKTEINFDDLNNTSDNKKPTEKPTENPTQPAVEATSRPTQAPTESNDGDAEIDIPLW